MKYVNSFMRLGFVGILLSGSCWGAEESGFVKAIVPTPTLCVTLDRVENRQVFLKKTATQCQMPGEGRIEVELPAGLSRVLLLVDGSPWKTVPVTGTDIIEQVAAMQETSQVTSAAKDAAIALGLPDTPGEDSPAFAAAKEVATLVNSEKYRKMAEAQVDVLKQELAAKQDGGLKTHYSDARLTASKIAEISKSPIGLAGDERMYLFVSSSVPQTTLRTYAENIGMAGGGINMIIRGGIGGMSHVKPTMEFLAKVLIQDLSCLQKYGEFGTCQSFNTQVLIDPLLFKRYRIDRVPALVFAKGVNPSDPEASEGDSERTPSPESFYVIYGDAGLPAMVEYLQKESGSTSLVSAKKALEKNYYR